MGPAVVNSRSPRFGALLAVVLCVLMLFGPSRAMHSASYAIEWSVVGAGGGSIAAAANALTGTAGQNAAGQSASTDFGLCAGFWCHEEPQDRAFLPLVLRET